jgi:hypothetical protein
MQMKCLVKSLKGMKYHLPSFSYFSYFFFGKVVILF